MPGATRIATSRMRCSALRSDISAAYVPAGCAGLESAACAAAATGRRQSESNAPLAANRNGAPRPRPVAVEPRIDAITMAHHRLGAPAAYWIFRTTDRDGFRA